jgi:hypothetical protein
MHLLAENTKFFVIDVHPVRRRLSETQPMWRKFFALDLEVRDPAASCRDSATLSLPCGEKKQSSNPLIKMAVADRKKTRQHENICQESLAHEVSGDEACR